MSEPASLPLITIGLVTDLHYAPGVTGSRYYRDSLAKLRKAVEDFRVQAPDLVINLGDSIDTAGSVEEQLRHIGEIRQVLAGVEADTHHLLGNHDVGELTREQFLAEVPDRPAPSYYSFDCRGVHIVMLDSNYNADGSPFSAGNFCWNDARIGEDQIAWLKADLAAADSMPILVFCHANLDNRRLKDGTLNRHIVRDATAVREVLEVSGSVKGVVTGHCHAGGQSTINGIPYIILNAMVEGPGLENNAYALLSLTADGELILDGFGRQPSMRFTPQPDRSELLNA